MIVRRSGLLVAASAVVALLAGCGSSGNTHQLSSSDATAMHKSLVLVRQVAAGHDRVRAGAALDRFAQLVHQRAVAGDFSAAESKAFRTVIANARARLPIDVTVPVAVVTPPVATPAPQPKPHVDKHPLEHGAKKLWERAKKLLKDHK